MSYSFEYIDIILLAMIAGFIFLRLRGILGKKTGFEEDINSSFPHEAPPTNPVADLNVTKFDDNVTRYFKQKPPQLRRGLRVVPTGLEPVTL